MTFKRVLIALAILALPGFLFLVALQPADFVITRTLLMSAPTAAVFAQVNDFHKWQAWSPWAKMDPNARNAYEGPASGAGAIFRWDGNKKVGAGSMTITDSQPNGFISVRLDFLRPFKVTDSAVFAFGPLGDQTAVTWTMTGRNGFVAKAIGLFMDWDKTIGGQFEQGLQNMKRIVEAEPRR